jgi:membrane protein
MSHRAERCACRGRIWSAIVHLWYSLGSGGARLDDGRRRFAEGPSEIPARGWKDIFLRVYNSISEDRIFSNAAGVTFYSLLAFVSGHCSSVSIYGLFADPSTIVSHLDTISGFAPGGAIDVLRQQLTRLVLAFSSAS